MPRVRHYKTTTTFRRNGTSIRTVRSRVFLGPYSSPGETLGNCLLVVGLMFLFWPWIPGLLPSGLEIPIGVVWDVSLVLVLLIFFAWARGRRQAKQVRRPSTDAKPKGASWRDRL
jgi:hypothetical protein